MNDKQKPDLSWLADCMQMAGMPAEEDRPSIEKRESKTPKTQIPKGYNMTNTKTMKASTYAMWGGIVLLTTGIGIFSRFVMDDAWSSTNRPSLLALSFTYAIAGSWCLGVFVALRFFRPESKGR